MSTKKIIPTEHTPGPWRVGQGDNTCRIYADGEDHAIARTYGAGLNGIGVCELTGPMNEADAYLIAAAPDMKQALLAFMDVSEVLLSQGNRELSEARRLAIMALQKGAGPDTRFTSKR